jgi:transcriptional regulator with XRE-family HTH domain
MSADSLTANQLIGYNLSRIRRQLGLSQEEAAERLAPYLGTRWSKTVFSAAERSYYGDRVRQFDGDELLAMSLAFGVPPAYFFVPPRLEDRPDGAVLASGKDVSWPQLVAALEDGEMRAAYDQRLAELPPDERPMRAFKESEIREYLDVADMARRHREERDG